MRSIWTGELEAIPDQHDGVVIRKIDGDLQSSGLRLAPVDGILMANALHFIQEQRALLGLSGKNSKTDAGRVVLLVDFYAGRDRAGLKPDQFGTPASSISTANV